MYLSGIIFMVLSNWLTTTTTQYVDFFQGLQAFLQPYQQNNGYNNFYDYTTRRTISRKSENRQPTVDYNAYNSPNSYTLYPTTLKPKKAARPNSSQNRPTTKKPNKLSQTTRLPWEDNIFDFNSYTTSPNYNLNSSINKQNQNKRPSNNAPTETKQNNKQNGVTTTLNNDQDNVVNSFSSKQNTTNRVTSNRDVNVSAFIKTSTKENLVLNNKRPNYNSVSTKRPLASGAKPAPFDENNPPITNTPDTRPMFGNVRPSNTATGNEEPIPSPTIEIGPDEDDMTPVEKRRYIDIAEAMCDNYKALSVKKVVALPLVPSPEGIAVNVSQCTPLNVALIIGGKVSNIEEFPHMALLGWMTIQRNSYAWKCGGSLISDRYVLTAGHCTYHEKDYNVVSGPPHAVQLGSSFLENPDAVVVKVASVIRHPKYKQNRSYFDIAMVKMASRVTFSDAIRPACLGTPPDVGEPIIATGWGRTEFGGEQSNELRSVSLPIWDLQNCREIWGTSLKLPNGPTSESHICAGEKEGGKDTCQGDSGGPAQIQDGCAWRVVAVTSYGRSCGAPLTPALYARVPIAFVSAQVFVKSRYENLQQENNKYQSTGQGNKQSAVQQQSNKDYGSQQSNDYGNQQYTTKKYSNQQLSSSNVNKQNNNNEYGSSQNTNNGNVYQQQNNNAYESQQYTTNKYDNQLQNNGNVNKEDYINKYGSSQNSNNGNQQSSDHFTKQENYNQYASQQQSNNYQQTTNRYSNQQQTTNRYSNQQQTTNRYSDQQQTTNRYSNQQFYDNKNQQSNIYENGNYGAYEQNPNIYQQYQQETNPWNHRNGYTRDQYSGGRWGNERYPNDYGANSWRQDRPYQDNNYYFGSTSRPWWYK